MSQIATLTPEQRAELEAWEKQRLSPEEFAARVAAGDASPDGAVAAQPPAMSWRCVRGANPDWLPPGAYIDVETQRVKTGHLEES